MLFRSTELTTEEAEVAEEVASEPSPEETDVTYIGLHHGGPGADVAFVKAPNGSFADDTGRCRERVVRVGGQNFEHVAEDSLDRWIYRRM